MAYGWQGKILEVDLTSGRIASRDTLAYREYVGGRSLAARLAWESIPPDVDAFHPENRITIATGPLTGTLAPTTGRTVMTAISPRTYPRPWYTHSTLGGWFGPACKYAGYDAIVIHGQAASPVYLDICRADGTTIDGAGFGRLLDEYYAARSWDLTLGWPTAEALARLGLPELGPELAALRQQRSTN